MPRCPAAGEFAREIETLQLISHHSTSKCYVRPGKLNVTSWNQWDNLFVYNFFFLSLSPKFTMTSDSDSEFWSTLWFLSFFWVKVCAMHVKCVSVLNLSWQKPSVPSSDCKQTHTMASLLDKTTGGQHFFLKKKVFYRWPTPWNVQAPTVSSRVKFEHFQGT